jgi:phosphoribosylaminoimidazolecarboxamide formyltransferase/IMP cyclohydrolase
MQLRYGCNPHQSFAHAEPVNPENAPLELLNGHPSFINLLDALNAWQLVSELRVALDMPAAASFKHVSPAGAAVAVPLSENLAYAYEVADRELTPAAVAYIRARGADPKSSFGDFVAISEVVDLDTARFLKTVVSDGIIAPGYETNAFEVLQSKKGGSFIMFQANPDFEPPQHEQREVFGMRLIQERNHQPIQRSHLTQVICGELNDHAQRDLILGLITLKYTQSNSVGYALGGQMIGIGAGQQSRVDCTKLAGAKADVWYLRQHPKVLGLAFKSGVRRQERINWRVRYIEGDLTSAEQQAFNNVLVSPVARLTADERQEWLAQLGGVSLVSDGFIPFRDNIDHASKHGVGYVAQPGGSARDAEIEAACREYGITMAHTDLRLFHH